MRSEIRLSLEHSGIWGAQLAQPLSASELIRFAEAFGKPVREPAARAAQFHEHDYVLNVRATFAATDDKGLQPFAANELTFHTEGSTWPAALSPRYLFFQAMSDAEPDTGGQTILVRVSSALGQLSDGERRVIGSVGFRRIDDTFSPILSNDGAGSRFAFRDHGDEPFPWELLSGEYVESWRAECCLAKLIEGIYSAPVRGLVQRTGRLTIIDNRQFLHARSRIMSSSARHLQRVVIVEGQ